MEGVSVSTYARGVWDRLRRDHPACSIAEVADLDLDRAKALSREFDLLANNSKSDIIHHCEVRQTASYRESGKDCYKLVLRLGPDDLTIP